VVSKFQIFLASLCIGGDDGPLMTIWMDTTGDGNPYPTVAAAALAAMKERNV